MDGEWALYLLDPGERGPLRNSCSIAPETKPPRQFSPDGKFLAFVGNDGDQQDLFVLDLESGAVDQLTDDAAQELSPVWIPSS